MCACVSPEQRESFPFRMVPRSTPASCALPPPWPVLSRLDKRREKGLPTPTDCKQHQAATKIQAGVERLKNEGAGEGPPPQKVGRLPKRSRVKTRGCIETRTDFQTARVEHQFGFHQTGAFHPGNPRPKLGMDEDLVASEPRTAIPVTFTQGTCLHILTLLLCDLPNSNWPRDPRARSTTPGEDPGLSGAAVVREGADEPPWGWVRVSVFAVAVGWCLNPGRKRMPVFGTHMGEKVAEILRVASFRASQTHPPKTRKGLSWAEPSLVPHMSE